MEPIKINMWAVGEFILIVIGAIAFIVSVVTAQIPLPIAGLYCLATAAICSVESEQRNAD